LIQGAVRIVDAVKKPGAEKKAEVIDRLIHQVPAGLALAEQALGKDLFNDPAIAQLMSAAIDAEAFAKKTHDALVAGLINKAALAK
jgi:hypothetical protein